MAAPLKSAKGKSSTVSFPRDGFFAPFRARWRDRRAADLMPEMRTGKPAESRIPGGDPEPPPGPTLGNPGKSCFLLGFPRKSQESQEFPRIFRGLLRISWNSQRKSENSLNPEESSQDISVSLGSFSFLDCFPWSSPGISQKFPEVPKNSQEVPKNSQENSKPPESFSAPPTFPQLFSSFPVFSSFPWENLLRKPGKIDGSAP